MSQEKMALSISPNYTSEKLENPSIEDKIDVFEDRMKSWLLAPMKKLLDEPHDRIASLCLQTTYFEGIWSYLVGKKSRGHSKEFFINGFYDVFKITQQNEGLLKRAAQILYEDVRCGFFHDGIFRDRIFFVDRGFALEITVPKKNGILNVEGKIQSIMIDPRLFYDAIEKHFDRYIKLIRNKENQDARKNFETTYAARLGKERIIGIDAPPGFVT